MADSGSASRGGREMIGGRFGGAAKEDGGGGDDCRRLFGEALVLSEGRRLISFRGGDCNSCRCSGSGSGSGSWCCW